MDFRDYAAGEVSELFGRLVTTSSDAAWRSAREALAGAMSALDAAAGSGRPDAGPQVQELVRRLADAADDATARVRTDFERELSTLRDQLAAARSELDGESTRAAALREELETESARAATLEADLDSVIEAHRQVDAARVEAEAARDEIQRAREAAEDAVAATRELLESAREEAGRLKEALDAESAQRAIVETELSEELENTRGLLAAARADVSRLQQAADADGSARERLEAELAQEAERARQARADVERLQAELAELADRRAHLEATLGEELASARAAAAAAEAEAVRLQAALSEEGARRAAIEAELTEELERARQQLVPARAEVERLEEAVDAECRRRAQLEAEIAKLRARASAHGAPIEAERSTAVLDAVRGLDELSAAPTVSDLMAAATRNLAAHFDRVALFRVRGNHLEGEHGSGLDSHLDVAKLSIPLGVESVLTRAVAQGRTEEADRVEIGRSPTPLGGNPEAAIALPVPFQGETFAVAYADAARPLTDVQRAFATLVVRQTGILLTRLTQELKTAKELGDYAALLLQEAQHMFQADLAGGRSEEERRKRLHETVECARQLYAQRAALEGTAAARLLEDQIAAIVNDPAQGEFARDLAAACLDADAHRQSSAVR